MFKKGDKVRCIDNNNLYNELTESKIYVVEEGLNCCLICIKNDRGNVSRYNETRFELVSNPIQEPFTPTIEIDFLIDYINNHQLEPNEIIAFLYGHKKGQVFIHEKLN